ncbi:MAG: 5-deoxy-glucuronate isomerase [Candidatus Hodarchaeota archaeon]
MERKIKSEFKPDYIELVSPTTHPLKKITFGLLTVKDNYNWKSYVEETVFILLSGKVKIYIRDLILNLGPRRSVFQERASAFWLPPNNSIKIEAESAEANLAVVKSPLDINDASSDYFILYPQDIKLNKRGHSNWLRKVYDIITPKHPSKSLIIGETINYPGNWSSFPPHRHDKDDYPNESCLEEIYFYQLDPPYGFGMQRLYNDDLSLDKAFILNNGDIVVIDQGYHPVVAAPGISLYYLWILAGEKRILAAKDDPKYEWLHNI